MSNIRVAYALGWVVDPIFGSWFGLAFGLRSLFLATALLYMLSLRPIARFSIARAQVGPGIGNAPAGRDSALTLLLFVGLCILAMSGETIKWSFLPLYIEENLNAPAWIRGAVISTHPFLELMLIPFGGWLSERFGAHRPILIGIACGIIAQLLFATGNSIPFFFLGQVFSSILIATVSSLGMTVAMDIHATGPGFATSVFLGGLGLSSTVGGLIGSIGVARLGLPHVFLLPAITGGIALIGMTVLFMKTPLLRHQGSI